MMHNPNADADTHTTNICPHYVSNNCRALLNDFEKIAAKHSIKLPPQLLEEVVLSEFAIMQFPVNAIVGVIRKFFTAWAKKVDKSKCRDARHLQYHLDALHLLDGKSCSINEARFKTLDAGVFNKFADTYLILSTQLVRGDFTQTELSAIHDIACTNVDRNVLIQTVRQVLDGGHVHVAYVREVLKSKVFVTQRMDVELDRLDERVLDVSTFKIPERADLIKNTEEIWQEALLRQELWR